MYPNSIQKLINFMTELPGIGEKSASRMAYSFVNFDKDKLTEFADSLIDIRDNIKDCSICGNITDKDVCDICSDKNRDNNIIIVVENAKDIILFEKIHINNCKYHVLKGLISPLDGINPEDINIDSLIKRVHLDNCKEVILALKPSIEGETTMQYIKKLLENTNIKVTRIASGVPIGADMEYVDSMTLEMAIDERKDIA